jgi:hypothetical protein
VIFAGRRGKAAGTRRPERPGRDTPTVDPDELHGAIRPEVLTPVPEFGPYDVTQAPDDEQTRVDLGALQLPAVPGVEIQIQAGPDGQVQHIQLAHGASRLQLAVYAAPRSEGIWDEVRAEMQATLAANGSKPKEIDGEYGPELRAQQRQQDGVIDLRHVGIDGPRWFVHGIFAGAAAIDPDQAGPLRDVLHGLVVDRGAEARPVREALPLRLPPEAAAQIATATDQAAGGPDGGRAS